MENYEKLLAELRDTASQLSAVYDTAFHLYSKAAEKSYRAECAINSRLNACWMA